MEITDLNPEERVALVAILDAVMCADSSASAEEQTQLDDVVDALGVDVYRAALDEAEQRFRGEDALKAFLLSTGRPEARDLIYATAFAAAMSDGADANELAILDWLQVAWQLDVEIEEPDDQDEP